MITIFIHFASAIILFFFINWIGKRSLSIGYIQLSAFEQETQAPALNFTIRFGGPLLYLILLSSFFFWIGQESLVVNIYLVVVYYFIFRFGFNIIWDRALLIGWFGEIVLAGLSIGASYFLYVNLISVKQRLVPDANTIANELWVIVAIFLYTVVNKIEISSAPAGRRSRNYQRKMYDHLTKRYGEIVDSVTADRDVKLLIYAVMIFESFNRPRIVRTLERLLHPLGLSKTLGVMQVDTNEKIDDSESVRIGATRLAESYEDFLDDSRKTRPGEDLWYLRYQARDKVIANYNRGSIYLDEIAQLYDSLSREALSSSVRNDIEMVEETLDVEDPIYEPESGLAIFRAGNPDEFVKAIGSNRIIEVTGIYQLDQVENTFKSEHVRWRTEFDGSTLVIRRVENLTIRASGEARMVVEPRYSHVLAFENCRKITISGLILGHSPEGYCTGGVIAATNCNDFRVVECSMFGCGTEGLTLDSVTDFEMRSSSIYDCSYGIVTISNSSQVSFRECSFHGNREFYGFVVTDSNRIALVDCAVFDNEASQRFFQNSSGDTIIFKGGRIEANQFHSLGDVDISGSIVRKNIRSSDDISQSPRDRTK